MAHGAARTWNAFLVMLLGCACWTFFPVLLLLASIGVGAPHGLGLRALLFLYSFLGFSCLFKFHQHVCLMSIPAALAATAPPSWSRLAAAASVVMILIYGWCATGPEPWKPRPAVYKFICDWGPRWFAEASLRGELPDGCTSKCCFLFHPHGVIGHGFLFNGACNPRFVNWAGRVNWVLDFRLRYCVPSLRWLLDTAWSDTLRFVDNGKSTVKALMEAGENLSLIAGGVSEVALYEYGKHCSDINRRKGLVKYCLQYGYRMFPIYTFGETTTYWSYTGFRELRLAVARATSMPPVLFLGWPWMPAFPRQEARLITYIGSGIDLPQIEEPTVEQIDHWHATYVEALKKLFEERKGEAGYPDATLEIL